MKCFDSFYEEASYALSRLLKVEPELADTGCGVCHGAYHYHNVLILPDYSVATVNFESMCYQPYLLDLDVYKRQMQTDGRQVPHYTSVPLQNTSYNPLVSYLTPFHRMQQLPSTDASV